MGRGFTESERIEWEKKRRKSLEETAALLGMTPEELEALEAKARAEVEAEYPIEEPSYVGYQVLDSANKLIEQLTEKFDEYVDRELSATISVIPDYVSTYQKSLMYKALGECYTKHGQHEKAIASFERGLEINPRLPVKKALKALKSEK